MQEQATRKYLRVNEISEDTGISTSEIYRAITTGELPASKFRERTWLIRPDDVELWIERNSTPNTPATGDM